MLFGFSIDRTCAAKEAAERAKARMERKAQHVDPVTLRRAERPQDREVTPHAVLWANGLPSRMRPDGLLVRYPHVANRLALCWPDKRLTDCLLEQLLVDKRGGRKGFPAAVREELLRLREAVPRTMHVDSVTPHWDLHSQATSDR